MYEDIINDGTKRGFMAIGKFYNLPEYKRTRDWVSRSPKTAKNLNKGWLPPHGEVNLIQYPDGSITVLNGHTRRYCWMNDMAPAPTKVRYTLYILDKDNPDEHAKNLYYSLDSVDSYDRSNELIQGMYRELGVDFLNFQTKKFRAGRITTILNAAGDCHPRISNWNDKEECLIEFMDDIAALDQIGIKKRVESQNALVAFLLRLINKYRNDAQMQTVVSKVVTRLNNNKGTYEDGPIDGIDHIIREYNKTNSDSTILFESLGRKSKIKRCNSGGNLAQMKFLHYCFDKFLEGKKFTIYKPGVNQNFYKDFYHKGVINNNG